MGKVLAIDYGIKRTGLALSDESRIFAFGQGTIDTKNIRQILTTLIDKEKISTLVIGEPKRLNNEISDTTQLVYRFKKDLEKWFPEMEIALIDERYTSKMAFDSIVQSGLKKKDRRNKALIDEVSATLILQSYLEMK